MSLSDWQKALTKKADLYLVGGKVRDAMLGLADRDLDVDYLVQGIPPDELETILKGYGRLQLVGKSFGVYKFKPEGDSVEVDAIPPDIIRELVRGCIEQHIDQERLEKLRAVEELERATLMRFAGHDMEELNDAADAWGLE